MARNASNDVVVFVLRIDVVVLAGGATRIVAPASVVCLFDKSSFNAFISSAVNCDAMPGDEDGDDMFSCNVEGNSRETKILTVGDD